MSAGRRAALRALLAFAAPARAIASPPFIAKASMELCCPVVELRQYTLHPGQRDVLIELFEREFVAPQNAVGARLIGRFRDLDDPDRFVWLRGFESMEQRAQALAAFYGGPVWAAHRSAANATIVDSDNVLLLRPLRAGGGFALDDGRVDKPPPGELVAATIHYLDPKLAAPFADFFATRLLPHIEAQGAVVLGAFVSETGVNSFPRLPVRADDHVLAWFARFADEDAHRRFRDRLHADTAWREAVPESLLPAFMRKPEVLRLSPTERSGRLVRPHSIA